MSAKEVRAILFPDQLFLDVNALVSDELKLAGIQLGNGFTIVPLELFLYTYTYSDATLFSTVYSDVIAQTVASIVPTSGAVIKVETDNSLTFVGESIDLSGYPAGTFLVDGDVYVHDDVRESVVISAAIAQTDISVTPHVTAPMMAAFGAFNIESFTQLANLNYTQWVGLNGEADYDKYEEAILYAAGAAEDFWANL